jgi:phosphoglycolate phosphatase
MDGTLIESTGAIVESFLFAFEDQGVPFTKKEQNIIDLIGYPLEYKFDKLGVPKEKVWDFVESYKKNYRKIANEQTSLLENARESIELAKSFAALGVVTTKTTQYTLELLKKFDLEHYFDTVIGRQDVENPKPHPEPILKACENLNIMPSNKIFMIGDTKLDLIASNKAKIQSIAVLCGYGKEEELSMYTVNICSDSLDAVKLIKRLISKA